MMVRNIQIIQSIIIIETTANRLIRQLKSEMPVVCEWPLNEQMLDSMRYFKKNSDKELHNAKSQTNKEIYFGFILLKSAPKSHFHEA